MAEYSLLRREVDTSRELYASLLGRLRETQSSAARFTSNISVVDRAEVPSTPYKPNKAQNLLLACLVGLVGGVGLAFLFEYLDTNIKDTKEVESVLRVPALGLVPSRHLGQGRRARRALAAGDSAPFALLAHSQMGSVFSEAFRNLRTSLLYSTPDHPPKTILVTSPHPEDGKTSLVTNLAITLAQLGSGEILVIDADMRRPNLHEILELPKAPGLSTYLTGQAELADVVVASAIPNLSVIPAGLVPLNPSELLASARFKQALDTLGQRFAYIIVDTGPLFGVSDGMILAGQVEGVVLVLRQGRASRDAAQRAIRSRALVVALALVVAGALAFVIVRPVVAHRLAMNATSTEDLARAAAWDPNDPAVHIWLGHAYERQGDLDRARARFDEAHRLRPSEAYPVMQLGLLAERRRDPQAARDAIRTALALDPHHVAIRWDAALLALRLDDREQALDHLRYVLAVDPAQRDAAFQLGRALLRPDE